jgi:ribosomal-protein-alanine N-acetyltransferase
MLPELIETERVVLRSWRFEDVGDVLAYACDQEWGRYLPIPHPYTELDARRFIAAQVLQDAKEHPTWAVEHQGRVIGGINLRLSAERQIAEMGYSIARAFWRRGLATEAASAVIDAAFDACPVLVRVRAMADARNVASTRVLEKLGMKREGTLRSNRFLGGEPVDEVWCGILRNEWALRRASQPRKPT